MLINPSNLKQKLKLSTKEVTRYNFRLMLEISRKFPERARVSLRNFPEKACKENNSICKKMGL